MRNGGKPFLLRKQVQTGSIEGVMTPESRGHQDFLRQNAIYQPSHQFWISQEEVILIIIFVLFQIQLYVVNPNEVIAHVSKHLEFQCTYV